MARLDRAQDPSFPCLVGVLTKYYQDDLGPARARRARSAPPPPQHDLGWEMKGNILDFSIADGTGVITGEDGNRYRFEGREWKSAARQPTAGLPVDFVAGRIGHGN